MADFQILCINKTSDYNPHARIVSVGSVNEGRRWSLTQQDAVHSIETLGHRFCVGPRGNGVWVVVAMHHGKKYIKAENDAAHPHNLLSLSDKKINPLAISPRRARAPRAGAKALAECA